MYVNFAGRHVNSVDADNVQGQAGLALPGLQSAVLGGSSAALALVISVPPPAHNCCNRPGLYCPASCAPTGYSFWWDISYYWDWSAGGSTAGRLVYSKKKDWDGRGRLTANKRARGKKPEARITETATEPEIEAAPFLRQRRPNLAIGRRFLDTTPSRKGGSGRGAAV